MQRTYLPLLALAASAAAPVWAASVFNSQPLDQGRFAVLAQPVGKSDWKLLVLEQIQPQPRCWEERSDGMIDPALNRFDFSGICSRYIDSNGYSLRVDGEDLANRYRLRLEQQGNSVALLAMSPSQAEELVVGRGNLPGRDREAFVAIQLERGWALERRLYGSQTLSHVYFANATPLAQLVAKASRSGGSDTPKPITSLGPLKPLPVQPGNNGPVALQVIPYRP
ncbi:MAG: hypothetical protein RLZZ11_2053 [Cyanobacteriota bacterium]|jgi:hypothetical protein